MATSKAYQTVIAGRVREDEQLKYFGQNKVTTPVGNFSTQRCGGSDAQPVITKNQQNEFVGKVRPVVAPAADSKIVRANNGNAIAEAYATGSNNSNK